MSARKAVFSSHSKSSSTVFLSYCNEPQNSIDFPVFLLDNIFISPMIIDIDLITFLLNYLQIIMKLNSVMLFLYDYSYYFGLHMSQNRLTVFLLSWYVLSIFFFWLDYFLILCNVCNCIFNWFWFPLFFEIIIYDILRVIDYKNLKVSGTLILKSDLCFRWKAKILPFDPS